MKQHCYQVLAMIGIAVFSHLAPAQDHGHLNVGAAGTSQDDPLIFDNGSIFTPDYGYVSTLNYTNGGKYAGYYQGNITFTALAATADHAGPVPNAPALGSRIFAQIVSVEGPPGGVFSFWDTGATNATISRPSGSLGTDTFQVSENDGSPESDPYGHFHGRRFTATKPGLYTVSFRALDLSANGASGGPIHRPAEVLKIQFQAGVNITSLSPTNGGTAVTFGAPAKRNFVVEYTTSLSVNSQWTQCGEAVAGNDLIATCIDPNAEGASRFYRVRELTP